MKYYWSGEITNVTDETTAYRFVTEAEFHTLVVSPWTREILPLCYSRPRAPVIGPVTWTPPRQVKF